MSDSFTFAEFVRRIRAGDDRAAAELVRRYEPAIRLGRRVLDMAPAGMKRIQFGLTGSDANETQLKIVWYYNNVRGKPEKKAQAVASASTR